MISTPTTNQSITYFDVALKQHGMLVFAPHGTSMLPMLKDGQTIVVILPVNKTEDLKKYDVVFYKREDGTFVLHRIISKKESLFLCCGDNQVWLEKVDPSWIFGILVGYYKDGAYIDVKTNKEYLKYARRRVATRFSRRVVGKIKRVLNL